MHLFNDSIPKQDVQQDYILIAASERNGKTTVWFQRRWETCDLEHDIIIKVC